jgi:hypothetical protein
MSIEADNNSIRVIGNNVTGIAFYDDDRTLRHEIYLKADNTLNISGTLAATYSTSVPDTSGGFDVNAQHTWTGKQTFMETTIAQDIVPHTTDAHDLGAAGKLWRKVYASEFETTLFAANTITVSGARQIWGHGAGTLAAYLSATADTADFGMAMTEGDFVEMRGYGQVEYFEVGANVAGTVYKIGADASGARDLDGSGANVWPAGTPFLVLGASGDGRVEVDASGPRISILEQGATYDANTEYVRIGNMRALFGTGANDRWGFGVGDYASGNYLSYNAETADKFLIRVGDSAVQLGEDGVSISTGTGIVNGIHWYGALGESAWIRTYDTDEGSGVADVSNLILAAPYDAEGSYLSGRVMLIASTGGAPNYCYFGADPKSYGGAVVRGDYADLRIGGGLYVGATNVDPAADWIYADGGLFIGDTACADTTIGAVINQGANDDAILVLKSSDVSHAITSQAEADTYARFQKAEATSGGLNIQGFKDAHGAAGYAVNINGKLGEAADTTKSTSGIGVVTINAQVTDGSDGVQAVGADGNLLAIRTHTTTRFIFDAEGSAHGDVEWTTFDEHDDAALLTNLETTLTDWQRNPVKAEFGQWLTEEAAQLEALGIVHFDRDNPGHAMVNTTRLSMLLVGALRQMSTRLNALEAQ